MDTQQNCAIVRRFLAEVIGHADLAVADELCSPAMRWHGAGVGDLPSLDALKALLGPFFAALPDLEMTIEDLVAEGDRVVARYTWRGAQRGAFQGLPPTGRAVAVAGTGIFRLMDSRIVEEWWLEDLLGLMGQLGALPVPA